MSNSLAGESLISVEDDLDRERLYCIFEETDSIKKAYEKEKNSEVFYGKSLEGKVVSLLFYEPSTRTKNSFSAALQRLGGSEIGFTGTEGTSVKKGESLADTVKTMSQYSEVLVLRHPEEGSAQWAANNVEVPVLNAGDGANNHPTQTILDLYTIYELIPTRNLNLGLVGDLKFGRTIHSLITALTSYLENWISSITLISPSSLELPEQWTNKIDRSSIERTTLNSMEVKGLDVVYLTRIQEERFSDPEEYQKAKGSLIFGQQQIEDLPDRALVMHPLPRRDEMDHQAVDDSLKCKIFSPQVQNGMWTRMALFHLISGGAA